MLTVELQATLHSFLARSSVTRLPSTWRHRAQQLSFPNSRRHQSSSSSHRITVLGLESSADDTCASVVSCSAANNSVGCEKPTILSNIVLKQAHVHETFGGIHPLHAQESHLKNMPLAIKSALSAARLTLGEMDGIAFTRGPGMFGCLGVCGTSAKALAAASGLPLLGVHHMQAHALTPFLTEETPPEFPFLTLLVSGGHTLLVLANSVSSFEVLATTHDESIGASFDKACRDLQLPWNLTSTKAPGAALEAFANFPTAPNPLPLGSFSTIPFRNQLAFSFSGLRSQLDRVLAKEPVVEMEEERKRDLARRFVGAAVAQVEDKVALALKSLEEEGKLGGKELGALVCSGGVASNQYLRTRLRRMLDAKGYASLRLVFPPPSLCTDNAAMIAFVGLSRLLRGRVDELSVMQRAKWTIEDCESDFME